MLYRFIGLLLLSVPAATLSAANANFIQQRALDPIKLQTGLPTAASRLTTTNELQLSVVHSNVFMGGLAETERLVLDGESSQLNLRYRRQLNPCWQLNVDASWLSHSMGWFDRPVDDFHQFFGLPDAQRSDWPANQLDYSYETGDQQQTLSGESHGLGDAQIQVQRNVGCRNNATVLRAGIKLPIGANEQFLGSGAIDAFIDVQSPWKKPSQGSRWQMAGSVGLLKAGESDFIAEQASMVGFGVVGLNVSLTAKTQLLGQLDWHTPMFKSDLRELGKTAAQVSLGLRYQTKTRGAWEVSFSEDAAIDTSPDIVVRLAWVSRFDALSRLK